MSAIDVLFIYPSGNNYLGFPFGISTLAAILRKNNFQVSILDASADKLTVSQVADRVRNIKPGIVAFTGPIHTSLFNKELSKMLRELTPSVIQIGGGWWAIPAPEFILRNVSIDYIIKGEADTIIVRLVKALIERESISEISGLCYLDSNGMYRENGVIQLPLNLDDIPFPAYDLLNMDYYILKIKPEKWIWSMKRLPQLKRILKDKVFKVASISSGRGCYGKCDFCSAAQIPRRNFSPGYIADNMVFLIKNYGVNAFYFNESLTLSTRQWVKDFCREILSRKMNIFYAGLSRGDFNYDSETLDMLFDSGCLGMDVGFESGSNAMLKMMQKNTTVEKYYKTYSDFSNKNIHIFGQFILNMPGESLQTLNETIAFVKNTYMSFSFGVAHPYPGSKLYEFARKNSFCTLEGMMFSLENKGKTTKRAIKRYFDKFNFNNLNLSDFLAKWRILENLKTRNYLFQKGHRKLVKILDFCPILLDFWHGMLRGALYFRYAVILAKRKMQIIKPEALNRMEKNSSTRTK